MILLLTSAHLIQAKTSSITPPKNFKKPIDCVFQVKWIVAEAHLSNRAQILADKLTDSFFADIGFCFSPITVEPALLKQCKTDRLDRIECDLRRLSDTLRETGQTDFSHLIVMLQHGGANTRGGVMFLDVRDSLAVVIHEMSHWLGYVDEYEVAWAQQKSICHNRHGQWVGKNLFVTEKTTAQSQVDELAGRRVYPTNTCNGTDFQAYKIFPESSFLEFLDMAVSADFIEHMKSNVQRERVIPGAMNLALANKVADYEILESVEKNRLLQEYKFWLKQAAEYAYPAAMRMWSQQLVADNKLVDAYRYLTRAARTGDSTSQVLLGHSYLEGSWLPRDLKESAYWYDKAAQQSDPFGLYFYGKCFEMGWGCIQSKAKAITLYKQAADKGSELAQNRLKQMDLASH